MIQTVTMEYGSKNYLGVLGERKLVDEMWFCNQT